MSKQVVTVRASSWGRLFDCAYAWEAEHLMGMRRPSGLRAVLGTAIHAGTAAFDQARMDGRPIPIGDAAEVFIDALQNPEDETDYRGDNITLTHAEKIGLALTVKYCGDISPMFRYTSVEMKLAPYELDCGDGLTIRLTGSMDRSRTGYLTHMLENGHEILIPDQKGVVIPDIKSGARIIDEGGRVILKGKKAQLGAYQLMYEKTTGQNTAGGQIIGLQTTSKALVGVSGLLDGKRAMFGENNERGLIELAAVMFKTGFFPPNPQSQLCSPKFCARWDTCIFHD